MNSMVDSKLTTQADAEGWKASQRKDKSSRQTDGQFFSPPQIATHLASWFEPESFNQPSLHFLDPGAGGGILISALVERFIETRNRGEAPLTKEITLEAWEIEEEFIPTLDLSFQNCQQALTEIGIRVVLKLNTADFIEAKCREQVPDMFSLGTKNPATHAILNPPYKKISKTSGARKLLARVGMDTGNLYSAFLWLAHRSLAKNGQLAAIVPRSFCNGPYFKNFRCDFVNTSNFTRLHLFESRSEAFSRDSVLQENILFHLSKEPPNNLPVIITTGVLDNPTRNLLDQDIFVSPSDRDMIIHLLESQAELAVRDYFSQLPCSLEDIGLNVSTGPVVDFRMREHLRSSLSSDSHPLLYPHCLNEGKVDLPKSNSSDYTDRRISKKPVAIREHAETQPWLLKKSRFVLVKRFSSKEEKRRIVAGVLDPDEFPSTHLGLENHLNFFHQNKAGLDAELAQGLSYFLNSTVTDRYFRQFNGHTQVNVSDLKNLRYPTLAQLRQLGSTKQVIIAQAEIDKHLVKYCKAPHL